jgi:hypothetical protein
MTGQTIEDRRQASATPNHAIKRGRAVIGNLHRLSNGIQRGMDGIVVTAPGEQPGYQRLAKTLDP